MINKKAQEEIVGFVAIVVLVAIVGVIFLAISVKNGPEVTESKDINMLLESSMAYTSDCALNYEPNYASLKDLIGRCYSEPSKNCVSNENICTSLNKTLKGILDASVNVNSESKKKGYIFVSEYRLNASSKENGTEIIAITRGNCSSNVFVQGDNFFSYTRGTITSTLKICY